MGGCRGRLLSEVNRSQQDGCSVIRPPRGTGIVRLTEPDAAGGAGVWGRGDRVSFCWGQSVGLVRRTAGGGTAVCVGLDAADLCA